MASQDELQVAITIGDPTNAGSVVVKFVSLARSTRDLQLAWQITSGHKFPLNYQIPYSEDWTHYSSGASDSGIGSDARQRPYRDPSRRQV